MERFRIIHLSKTNINSCSDSGSESSSKEQFEKSRQVVLQVLTQLEEFPTDFIQFETCMRKIYFLDRTRLDSKSLQILEETKSLPEFQVLSSEDAYSFILEIITGLHSNIKGETEIFGQFKGFIENLKTQNLQGIAYLNQILDQLTLDCKFLREKHVKNWGSQSYGSLTRKLLDKKTPVLMLGSGQLATEIAPWLSQIPQKYVARRNLQKEIPEEMKSFSQIKMSGFSESLKADEEVHLVIAAPLTNKEIVNLLEKLQTVKIIDWRGDDKLNLPGKEYFHLSDLKNLLAESEESLNQKVELVRQEIVNLIEKFKKKVQLNPWGWDDICA